MLTDEQTDGWMMDNKRTQNLTRASNSDALQTKTKQRNKLKKTRLTNIKKIQQAKQYNKSLKKLRLNNNNNNSQISTTNIKNKLTNTQKKKKLLCHITHLRNISIKAIPC